MCARHEATCDTQTQHSYPDGYYKVGSTIFEKMSDVGVDVPQELRIYPYYVCFDYESMMSLLTPQDAPRAGFTAEHVPISFSMCSNIPGLEKPEFRAHPSPAKLVQTFVDLLEDYSARSYELLEPFYRPYLLQLKTVAEQISKREKDSGRHKDRKNTHHDLAERLEEWLRQLIVLGFNNASYDLNVIKRHLIKILLREGEGVGGGEEEVEEEEEEEEKEEEGEAEYEASAKTCKARVIKRNNSMMMLSTKSWRMLDITNYLAPTSYSAYLKAFKIKEEKGYFCYEYLKRFDQLYETALPPYEAFYSTLNNKNSLDGDGSEEDGRRVWQSLQQLWQTKNMSTLMDFLHWYNDLDVTSFVEAVKVQKSLFWTHFHSDLFKDGISLPSCALKFAMKTTDAKFALYGKKYKWLHGEFREAVVGGPSLVYSRYHEKDITKIRPQQFGENAKTCQSVIGTDANALYLWAWSQDFPCGDFEVRMGPDFKREKRSQKGYSNAAIRWLDEEAEARGIRIVHALNSVGGEIKIGSSRHKVDGFCAEQNLILEFHGCFYHGCERCNDGRSEEIHPYYSMTFAEVRERTREKIKYFRDLGYEVVEKWECDYRKERPPPSKSGRNTLTSEDIIRMINNDELFGVAKVDILTPDWLKPALDEFPAIFKNSLVGREDISPLMRAYCERHNKLRKPTKMLISSHKADRMMFITPLLKYYLQLGLKITKVHYVVHFPDHKPCFKKFADQVSDARREGDRNPDSDVLANTYKLVGNSVYGKAATNKENQTDTVYANGFRTTYLANQQRFKMCRRLDHDLYEVELYKKKHVFDLPLHLAVFTYGYAKLRMLQWAHQFMQKYLPPDMYEIAQMDTDSYYCALAAPTLDACVRTNLIRNYYHNRDDWFPTESCRLHKRDFVAAKMLGQEWVMQKCCEEAHKHDLRTPGLFKLEFSGDGIVALCSKTYICFKEDENKISCKGIQKKRNHDVLTKENYLAVLRNQQAGYGINKGFVADNGRVYSYAQKRYGLGYQYCKRLVHDDGVSTSPLEL